MAGGRGGKGRKAMIGYLKGTIIAIESAYITLDVNDVGYMIYCGDKYCALANQGDEAVFYIETLMRESEIHLYGFATMQEKQWFKLLCKVQGVGAKMAMALLAQFDGAMLAKMIVAQDGKSLTQAVGVGAKLAQRIINELHDKLPPSLVLDAGNQAGEKSASSAEFDVALSGLIQLGFARHQCYEILLQIGENNDSADLLIKKALQKLSA